MVRPSLTLKGTLKLTGPRLDSRGHSILQRSGFTLHGGPCSVHAGPGWHPVWCRRRCGPPCVCSDRMLHIARPQMEIARQAREELSTSRSLRMEGLRCRGCEGMGVWDCARVCVGNCVGYVGYVGLFGVGAGASQCLPPSLPPSGQRSTRSGSPEGRAGSTPLRKRSQWEARGMVVSGTFTHEKERKA